jgi:hypothetical protein
VDVNAGSALDVLADTDAEGEVSAMQLLYSGELEAWNQKQRAFSVRQQGKNALLGGIISGLSGTADAAGSFGKAFSSTTPTPTATNLVTPYAGAGNTWRGNAFTYKPTHGF